MYISKKINKNKKKLENVCVIQKNVVTLQTKNN